MVVQALRLEEDLVAIPVGEPVDLVFDRWAIARTASGNRAGIDRRLVEVRVDDRVGLGRGPGNAAGDLGHIDPGGQETERDRLVIGRLHLEPVPMDRPAIEPSGGAGLEAPHRKAERVEPVRQSDGGRFANPAGGDTFGADMDDALQESAGRDDDLGRPVEGSRQADDASDLSVLDDQVFGAVLDDRQVRVRAEFGLHRFAVELPVDLRAGSPDGRTLRPVEHPELDAGLVGHASHDAVEGIDLPDEVALAKTADGRVATHLADGRPLVGDERGARAEAGRGRRSFAAGMAAANHDHIKVGRVRH